MASTTEKTKFKDKKRKVYWIAPETLERIEELRWRLRCTNNSVVERALEIGLEKLERILSNTPKP